MPWPRGRPRKAKREPQEGREHWILVCPGPSHLTHDLSSLQASGGVVAITEAIYADAPWTHWCHPEGPAHPHQARCRAYGPRIRELLPRKVTVWAGKDHYHRWTWWRLPLGHGEWWPVPFEAIEDEATAHEMLLSLGLPIPEHWARDSFSKGPTVWATLKAITQGARVIEVYGCDLDGTNNYDARSGRPIPNRRSYEWWQLRWRREARIMRDLADACRLLHVAFERHPAKARAA